MGLSRQETEKSHSSSKRSLFTENSYDYDEEDPRPIQCTWLPCCMDPEQAESFGHHVSVFMVALVAFATFFCVTLILILVFMLG
ncbi:unnamed protein product, partial [Mesorhabditis belari]|uniref:Uncharacterized protein n=1 Tax=Mesorhabditis belari TaxID=2138241 RepID=A0AAF3EWN4_9BILA